MSARPYRLTNVTPEDDLHASVARMLRQLVLPPAEWTCFPAGHVPLPPEYAAKLARMGLQRSWPDFILVFDARVFGLELKRKGGGLSRTRMVRTRRGALRELVGQDTMFPRLERSGMAIAVCTDTDEVLAALARWCIPRRIRTLVEMAA